MTIEQDKSMLAQRPVTLDPGQSESSVRTFQTDLTNQQFFEKGLLIVDRSASGKLANQFIGSNQDWGSSHSIVISANIDYSDLFIDHHVKSEPKQVAWLPQFDARLRELDETAVEDDIKISLDAQSDAKAFVKGLTGVRQPSVFLSGNGNIRLRWANERGEKVGLQFRGNAEVQYIFFKQVGDKTEHMLGIKLVSTIASFISACGLWHVVSE